MYLFYIKVFFLFFFISTKFLCYPSFIYQKLVKIFNNKTREIVVGKTDVVLQIKLTF